MEPTFNGLGMNLGNLARLSKAVTRSISAENPSGAKGEGGMATNGLVPVFNPFSNGKHAVIQGIGWSTLEQICYAPNGKVLTGCNAYKLPDIKF